MAWLKLHDTFYDDMKLLKLKNRLGVDEAKAVGHIALLWVWALRHAPDGDLSRFTSEEIEIAAKWDGPTNAFTQSCKSVRLLDENREESTLKIHNWMARGGSYVENKSRQIRRLRKMSADSPELSAHVRGRGEERRGEENRKHMSKSPDGASDAARQIWDHYRTYHQSAAKVLRSGRKEYKLIKARLEDGYSVDDLRRCIDGYHKSPHHLGQNDRNTKYLSAELFFRTASHVQRGIEFADGAQSTRRQPKLIPLDALAKPPEHDTDDN